MTSSHLFGAVLGAGLLAGIVVARVASGGTHWAAPISLPAPDSGAAAGVAIQLPSEPVSSAELAATPIVITATPFPSVPPDLGTVTAALSLPALTNTRTQPDRLIIPELGIDSTWLPLGYLANGTTMDSPPGPGDLGWYTFSNKPGGAGNAVFAGHVDWHTGAPALFAHLDRLAAGDEVDVSRDDGAVVRYHVVSATWYDYPQTNATPLIATTTAPTVTLITCGGVFDQTSHEYDKRLVVQAVSLPS